MIFDQIADAVASLSKEQFEQIMVVGITLDPERDDPDTLKSLAEARDLTAPQYHFLTGDPDRVNRVLDNYGFERTRDPETGQIDHSNFFILIDRKGRVAYTFTLGKTQSTWLKEALPLLIAEPDQPGSLPAP